MPRAALIILAWNQWPITRHCLESLRKTILEQADVIVVDNGSQDETPQALEQYADWVRIVRLPENSGFVRGMNAGIRHADPDSDVLLLNNDLEFLQLDWLERLRDAAYADPKTGIVGCRMVDGLGNLIHNGSFIIPDTLWGQQTETGFIERDIGQYRRVRRVQGIAFALAYIRRICLEQVGLLNEAFHSYFEDTDYCLRALQEGFFTVVTGHVTLLHAQHGSTRDDTGFRERLFAESQKKFQQLWGDELKQHYRANLLWQSVSRSPQPYAGLTSGLVRRLDAAGLRMYYRYADADHPELPATSDYRLEVAGRRCFKGSPMVGVVFAPLEYLTYPQEKYNIIYTFSNDIEKVKNNLKLINTFNEIWVPDTFQAEMFRNAGVHPNIRVIPLGIDPDYCHLQLMAPRHLRQHYVFLNIFEWHSQSSPESLIRAFEQAFTENDPVELLIYVPPTTDLDIEVAINTLARIPGRGVVRFLRDWSFPYYQRGQLYRAADAYVSMRHDVGWDIYSLEAVACGLPLIALDHGSMAELVREHGYPLAWHDSTILADPLSKSTVEELTEQFIQVYAEREQASKRARKSARVICEKYTLDHTAQSVLAALRELGVLRAE